MKHLKERLDVLLVKKGFYPSRERAKASIMAGIVYVDGQKSDKAGNMIDENAEIFVKDNICPYVSRGGLKLEKSMKLWPIDLKDTVCMDIGASTLPTACSKTVHARSMPWMWATDSSITSCESTPAL